MIYKCCVCVCVVCWAGWAFLKQVIAVREMINTKFSSTEREELGGVGTIGTYIIIHLHLF
jgi:hypothetical protein